MTKTRYLKDKKMCVRPGRRRHSRQWSRRHCAQRLCPWLPQSCHQWIQEWGGRGHHTWGASVKRNSWGENLRELTSSCWKMRTSESQGQVQQGPFAWQHRRFPKWCNWGYFSNTVSQLNSISRLHLLLVGGVQSENPHEEEVGARTENENWSWEGERVEEIPEKTKHGNGHCDPTDPQPDIALFYWYSSDHVRLRCQTFYSLRVYMNSGGSWVMTCTFHP